MLKKLFQMPVWGLLLLVAGVAVVILFIFSSLNPWNPMNYLGQPEIRVDVDRAAVVKEIQALNRLETASFTIEKIIEAGTAGNAFQEILYGDRLLLVAHGKVTAGVDLSKVMDDDVKISGDTMTIQLPAAEIFSTHLDNRQTKVYDRQQGLLSSGNKDLESTARQTAEESILQAACSSGILDEAANNAKDRIASMYQLVGFKSVNVEIPASGCQ